MAARRQQDTARPVPADTPPPQARPAGWVLLTARTPTDVHHRRDGADG